MNNVKIEKNQNNGNFTVNNTTNAYECGAFDEYYKMYGPKSRCEFFTLHVDSNGEFSLLVFKNNVSENDVNAFLTKPLRVYRKEFPNGIITTSLRGMVNDDTVHIPYSSPVDLRRVKLYDKKITCFLIDSVTDEIKGIRIIGLSFETIYQIISDWIAIEESGLTVEEISMSLNNDVYCHSLDEIKKRSDYVGKNTSSIVAKNIHMFIA